MKAQALKHDAAFSEREPAELLAVEETELLVQVGERIRRRCSRCNSAAAADYSHSTELTAADVEAEEVQNCAETEAAVPIVGTAEHSEYIRVHRFFAEDEADYGLLF